MQHYPDLPHCHRVCPAFCVSAARSVRANWSLQILANTVAARLPSIYNLFRCTDDQERYQCAQKGARNEV